MSSRAERAVAQRELVRRLLSDVAVLRGMTWGEALVYYGLTEVDL